MRRLSKMGRWLPGIEQVNSFWGFFSTPGRGDAGTLHVVKPLVRGNKARACLSQDTMRCAFNTHGNNRVATALLSPTKKTKGGKWPGRVKKELTGY